MSNRRMLSQSPPVKKTAFSYKNAGVDIDAADAAKREIRKNLDTSDKRVLNAVGAFASLFDGSFPGYRHPVLVLKTEEPGSKQKLAIQHGRIESICYDLINHLVNDIAVMGAAPVAVQDAILCGKIEPNVVNALVKSLAAACAAQGCVLTGGETSEQPSMLAAGTYMLTASIVGVVEKAKVIDGSKIAIGDKVLAVASNGLHTNGYALVRNLMEAKPEILKEKPCGESFLDAILRPHTCYYAGLRGLFDRPELHGLAHITGGGIQDNLNRILPAGTSAIIARAKLRILPIFSLIHSAGKVQDDDMARTFNLGVGLTLVSEPKAGDLIGAHLAKQGYESYEIGEIVKGDRTVRYRGKFTW